MIVQFNAKPRQLVDFQSELFVPLMINGQIPFKLKLKKLFEGTQFYLDRSSKSKHIFVSVNDVGYLSREEVKYVPKLTKVILSNDQEVLIVKVLEEINGQEKTCLSDTILYTFYRNQKLIGQNSIGYLNLTENGVEMDGLFKVIVSIMEGGVIVGELESQPLYLEQ